MIDNVNLKAVCLRGVYYTNPHTCMHAIFTHKKRTYKMITYERCITSIKLDQFITKSPNYSYLHYLTLKSVWFCLIDTDIQ